MPAHEKVVTEPEPPPAAFEGSTLDALTSSPEEFPNRPGPMPALENVEDLPDRYPVSRSESKSDFPIENFVHKPTALDFGRESPSLIPASLSDSPDDDPLDGPLYLVPFPSFPSCLAVLFLRV